MHAKNPLSPESSADGGQPGAEERFNALLAEYGAFLRRTVLRLCPTSLGVAAEEIEQEARIRIWRAVSRERNITEPASYLYRVAAAAAIDAVRRVRARREGQFALELDGSDAADACPSSAPSPEQLARDGQLAAQVRAAVAALPVNRRRAVALHLRGFTSIEIARLLGWTEPKARNLTWRGLNDLRARLRAAGVELSEQR
jgi:RNA polymerase sigma factor (sigma-70 family)